MHDIHATCKKYSKRKFGVGKHFEKNYVKGKHKCPGYI